MWIKIKLAVLKPTMVSRMGAWMGSTLAMGPT